VSEFLDRVEAAVGQRQLFRPGQKIMAAISGGVDSMVLLQALHSVSKQHRWSILVAHFNHRLRGRASDADERLVRKAAAQLRLRFIGGSADVKQTAVCLKISVEMAARKLRHEFLAQAARQNKVSTIALAHHADDQVELFFLRLLRGAGGEGIAGMKWQSPSPVDQAISLTRPLLEFSKAELLAFARKNKIPFREDATNFATDIMRNRVRRELLPLLRKKYQPGIDRMVLRLMDIVGAETDFVSAAGKTFCRRLEREAPGSTGHRPSEIVNFKRLPLAVQRKALQQQLTRIGLLADFELIERLRKVPEKAVSVCAGLSVSRAESGKLRCREQTAGKFDASEIRVDLSSTQGQVQFGGSRLNWGLERERRFRLPPKTNPGADSCTEHFDADRVGGQILLRHWRPGDRFQPIGLKSAVKLQDLFVNAKIPAARRRELVLAATAAGEIFWVNGLRIGEQFKLTPKTRRVLVWKRVWLK
jgi:tRNA(Ile)-lysidine synthase